MKVKDLIKKLKKMPPDLIVFWADHDHSEYETNNTAGSVDLIDKREDPHWEDGLEDCFKSTPEKYVVISP